MAWKRKSGNSDRSIFLHSKITGVHDCSHEIKMLTFWKESYYKLMQHIKKHKHHFANKGTYSQNYSFSHSHVWIWELDHRVGWAPKNWCFPLMVLEKTHESPFNFQGTNQSIVKKSTLNIHWKGWLWSSNTLATWCKESTHFQRFWERLKANGEEGGRGRDG